MKVAAGAFEVLNSLLWIRDPRYVPYLKSTGWAQSGTRRPVWRSHACRTAMA
jgi:hypothetical protein